jgi:hypothetical protein
MSVRCSFECALRAISLIKARFRKGMTRGDVAELMRDEFRFSRATSYRYAAAAIDLLGLEVDESNDARIERGIVRRSSKHGMLVGRG